MPNRTPEEWDEFWENCGNGISGFAEAVRKEAFKEAGSILKSYAYRADANHYDGWICAATYLQEFEGSDS